MHVSAEAEQLLADGFAAIVASQQLPVEFEPGIELAAREAIRRELATRPGRRDATDLAMVTLDPADSTDLDQAFFVTEDGRDIVLHYAIADVGAFVDEGSALEREAWKRGVTVYAPTNRVPVYPASLSQQAASLLPDGPRPAVLLTTAIAPDGAVVLRSAERVIVASTAKLAYETTRRSDLSPLVTEFAKRMALNEHVRGASRVEVPRQDVIHDPTAPGGVRLVLRGESESEDLNSSLSLATNLAVAQTMLSAGVGLFRVMEEPDEAEVLQLRRAAVGLGIAWKPEETLRNLQRRLDPSQPLHARFLLDARRAGGRAGYATLTADSRPWHSALAAPYAHATAPMRRLADRYVLDLVLAITNSSSLATTEPRLNELPPVMERSEGRAATVDRAVIDLLEAVGLVGREGDEFLAVVVDATRHDVTVQLADPAVRARIRRHDETIVEGDAVSVRLISADPMARSVKFVLCT